MRVLSKAAICTVVLTVVVLGAFLLVRGNRAKISATGQSHRYQRVALYLDPGGRTGISFGRTMGIGGIDTTPDLDPLRMQEWSRPIIDCSNQIFHCISADRFVIFLPVTPLAVGGVYHYHGMTLRVIDCAGAEPICTVRIMKEHLQPNGTLAIQDSDPLLVYLTASERGILSIGITGVPEDPHVASRQARLRGRVGLFGRLGPQ